jgi:hypothetical protein
MAQQQLVLAAGVAVIVVALGQMAELVAVALAEPEATELLEQ